MTHQPTQLSTVNLFIIVSVCTGLELIKVRRWGLKTCRDERMLPPFWRMAIRLILYFVGRGSVFFGKNYSTM